MHELFTIILHIYSYFYEYSEYLFSILSHISNYPFVHITHIVFNSSRVKLCILFCRMSRKNRRVCQVYHCNDIVAYKNYLTKKECAVSTKSAQKKEPARVRYDYTASHFIP